MRALVVQHDHVSPPGPVADRLADHGYDIELHEVVPEHLHHTPTVEANLPAFVDFDAIVLMGAPWSTYDHDLIGSWVLPEVEQVRNADRLGVAILGICFGGQLLSYAYGGGVAKSPHPELGWVEVDSDDVDLVPAGPWFQWHYDRWTLPPNASEIARNSSASQAFALRKNLAVQFHPELTTAMLEGWFAAGGREELEHHGLDEQEMLDQTRRNEPDSARRARALVDSFVGNFAGRSARSR